MFQFYAARDDNTGRICLLQITSPYAEGIHHLDITTNDKGILCKGIPVGISTTHEFTYPLDFPKHLPHIEMTLGNFLHLRGVRGNTREEALKNLNELYIYTYNSSSIIRW